MYWSRINTVDCRKRQEAEMNKDVRSFQAWVRRETEGSLGSTEAKRIWKEKFRLDRCESCSHCVWIEAQSWTMGRNGCEAESTGSLETEEKK